EGPFLKNGVFAIPQRQSQAETLCLVRDTAQPILVPSIYPRTRLVMIEILPGGPIRAVILPNGAPGTLGQVRPPQLPVLPSPTMILQPLPFGILSDGHRCHSLFRCRVALRRLLCDNLL